MTLLMDGHIALDEGGNPHLAGTRIKVIELIMAQRANRWSVEELVREFPPLSAASIHAALAYYFDHKQALDEAIAAETARAEQTRQAAESSPLAQRLQVLHLPL